MRRDPRVIGLGNTGEVVIWNGMTKAGAESLWQVLNKREVALQFVNVLPYVIEDVRLLDPAWQPVVLLPVRAANIDGPSWAFRLPPAAVPQFMLARGADGRHRRLEPQEGCCNADFFSV
jgi:hypothetical protein